MDCGTNAILIPIMAPYPIEIEDRIKNCNQSVQANFTSIVSWNLVARSTDPSSGKTYEVWQDSMTGILWGDKLDQQYTHYDAVVLDTNWDHRVLRELACNSEDGHRATAGITEVAFGLPQQQEIYQAVRDGLLEVLPNLRKGDYFWSASLDANYIDAAQVFDVQGNTSAQKGFNSVRCISRSIRK
jgi:hypothetical protein